MEPSPLGAASRDIQLPSNISKIVNALTGLAAKHDLLRFDGTTNFLVLETLTTDLIRAAERNGEDSYDLRFDILNLWFPSLMAGIAESGSGMSHFFCLDLEVQAILVNNGYVDIPELEEEDY